MKLNVQALKMLEDSTAERFANRQRTGVLDTLLPPGVPDGGSVSFPITYDLMNPDLIDAQK